MHTEQRFNKIILRLFVCVIEDVNSSCKSCCIDNNPILIQINCPSAFLKISYDLLIGPEGLSKPIKTLTFMIREFKINPIRFTKPLEQSYTKQIENQLLYDFAHS